MVKQNTTRNINKILFELENNFFDTHNNYSEAETLERWSIYSEILTQLQSFEKNHYIHELYYRTLLGDNINTVFIDLINRDNEIYFILYPFISVLEEFFDFDEIKIFV